MRESRGDLFIAWQEAAQSTDIFISATRDQEFFYVETEQKADLFSLVFSFSLSLSLAGSRR